RLDLPERLLPRGELGTRLGDGEGQSLALARQRALELLQLGGARSDLGDPVLQGGDRVDLARKPAVLLLQPPGQVDRLAHRTASSSADSIHSVAAASASGSADLTTTSTSLPCAWKLGYEPTSTSGCSASIACSTRTILLSVVWYVRRHEAI